MNQAIRYVRGLARRNVAIPAGECLLQVRKAFDPDIPALGDYDGDGAADAEDAYKRARADGTFHPITSTTRVPRGAVVLWGGGSSDNGHAAIGTGYGAGNDTVVWSPGIPSDATHWRKVTVRSITWGWGLPLLGYTTSLNGHPIPGLHPEGG